MILIRDGVALMHPAVAKALGLKEGASFLGASVQTTKAIPGEVRT